MWEQSPAMERKYRIICLKRSKFEHYYPKQHYISDWYKSAQLVYWLPNRCGYTSSVDEAGVYSASELQACGGSTGDWLLEPVWVIV